MTRICSSRSTSLRRRELSSLARQRTININRTPVLTLRAVVVAERLGFDRDTALTLGREVAGLIRMPELEGRPTGRDLEHWLRAEAELEATRHAKTA
jgi:hypothetical protein